MSDTTYNEIRAILDGLTQSHAILSGFVSSIPEAQLYVKRRDGFWSIAEHVAHLAEVQPMLVERIRRILEEDVPEFVPFIPDADDEAAPVPTPPINETLNIFKKARNEILNLLSSATSDDWKRSAVHPEYAQYGLLILARHILMHDHWHMYRLEELWLTHENYLTNLEG